MELGMATERIASLEEAVHRGIVGQEGFVKGLMTALVANGHVLVEGVPGLAKTRGVRLLAAASGTQFARVQFTPDLLPADIVGTQIYNHGADRFETRLGPVFTQFLLADEINRAAPKVQSALLEAMQERQVTIGETTHPLPQPFLVFATQNPVEQEGTYPLPEAQVDRFLFKLVVGYPSAEEEASVVRMVMDETALPEVEAVIDAEGVLALQAAAREVFVEEALIGYAVRIVEATRRPADVGLDLGRYIDLGASPRASIALIVAARARALIGGRDAAIPEDVKAVAPDVLRHRVLVNYLGQAEGVTADHVVEAILGAVKVP